MMLTAIAVVVVILFAAAGIAAQFTHSPLIAWLSLAFLIISVAMATIIAASRQSRRPGSPN